MSQSKRTPNIRTPESTDELLETLRPVVTRCGKPAVREVHRILARGISAAATVRLGELVDNLWHWGEVERLCLELLSRPPGGKKGALAANVAHRISNRIMEADRYPIGSRDDRDTVEMVRDWMEERIRTHTQQSTRTGAPGQGSERHASQTPPSQAASPLITGFRRILICLICDSRLDGNPEPLYGFLELVAGSRRRPVGARWEAALSTVLAGERPALARIRDYLGVVRPAREAVMEARADALRAEDEVGSLRSELEPLRKRCVESEAQVAELEKRMQKLQEQLKVSRDTEVESEKFWDQRMAQQLRIVRGEIARCLQHEVDQLRGCLDRPDANINMAIDRLNILDGLARRLSTEGTTNE